MADIDIKALTPGAAAASSVIVGAANTAAVSPSLFTTVGAGSVLLTNSGGTVTTNDPVLNLAQTWNAGAVTFTGLKFNATDTASAADTLLMDLQVGGTSQFKFKKDAFLNFGGNFWIGKIAAGTTAGFFTNALNNYYAVGASGFVATSTGTIGFSSSNTPVVADTILTRAAAAALQLGAADAAAPVAQTLQVQSVVAGTSNTAGVDWTIKGSAGTGTGAGGKIIFQTAAAGSTGTAQNAPTNTLSLYSATWGGASGAKLLIGGASDGIIGVGAGIWLGRPDVGGFNVFAGYFSSYTLCMASSTQFGFASGGPGTDIRSPDTIMTRAAAATWQLGAADAAAPVAQTLEVQSVVAGTSNTAGANWTIKGSAGTGTGAGGSIIFQVAPAGTTGTAQNAFQTALTINSDRSVTFGAGSTATQFITGFGKCYFGASANSTAAIYADAQTNEASIRLRGETMLGWSGTATNAGGTIDLFLGRDAANSLALRNGTSAQQFNIYNTYTDASNYERLQINWNSNDCYFQTTNSGTGLQRVLKINASQFEFMTGGATRWIFSGTGNMTCYVDNTYDIGAAGANRPRNIYVAGTVSTSVLTAQTLAVSSGTSTFNQVSIGGNLSYIWASRSRMLSPADGNIQLVNNAGTDFGLLQFGGATSSFPALKRSSASLQARLADDSAFAAVQGKLTTDSAYTAGAPTATGYLVLYDSTGTAYKVPAVAV